MWSSWLPFWNSFLFWLKIHCNLSTWVPLTKGKHWGVKYQTGSTLTSLANFHRSLNWVRSSWQLSLRWKVKGIGTKKDNSARSKIYHYKECNEKERKDRYHSLCKFFQQTALMAQQIPSHHSSESARYTPCLNEHADLVYVFDKIIIYSPCFHIYQCMWYPPNIPNINWCLPHTDSFR